MPHDPATGFREIALDLARECEGLSLIDADRALDDARRYMWLRHFSGASGDALDAELSNPELAVALRIAARLDGNVTNLEADKIFLEARLFLWMQTFARVPDSLFFQQLQAHAERPPPGSRMQ